MPPLRKAVSITHPSMQREREKCRAVYGWGETRLGKTWPAFRGRFHGQLWPKAGSAPSLGRLWPKKRVSSSSGRIHGQLLDITRQDHAIYLSAVWDDR